MAPTADTKEITPNNTDGQGKDTQGTRNNKLLWEKRNVERSHLLQQSFPRLHRECLPGVQHMLILHHRRRTGCLDISIKLYLLTAKHSSCGKDLDTREQLPPHTTHQAADIRFLDQDSKKAQEKQNPIRPCCHPPYTILVPRHPKALCTQWHKESGQW